MFLFCIWVDCTVIEISSSATEPVQRGFTAVGFLSDNYSLEPVKHNKPSSAADRKCYCPSLHEVSVSSHAVKH